MKKNSFRKILILVITLVSIISVPVANIKALPADINEEKPKLVFPVISDVHIGADYSEEKLKNILDDFKTTVNTYDAIAVVGDFTNAGKEHQYDSFMKIFNDNRIKDAESVLALGNHEYYAMDSNNSGYEKRFVKKTGMPAPYYDKWIKGYHFIVLAPEDQETANLSDVQIKWLSEKMEERRTESRPQFIFFHHPFSNTVYGSELWGWVDKNERVYGILKKYPEAILFTGHSHYTPENPKTICEREFTMVNTSSVYYTMANDNARAPFNLSHGLVVNVYDGRVEIGYREASSHKWIGKPYVIE